MDRNFIIFAVIASAASLLWGEACASKRNNFEKEFSAIGGVYIDESLLRNRSDIVAKLYIAQSALKVVSSRAENGLAAIFTDIKDLLIELSVLAEGESKSNLSTSKSAKARTASEFDIGNIVLLNVVTATQPNASAGVTAAQKQFSNAISGIVDKYYSGIDLALDDRKNCSQILKNIEAFKNSQVPVGAVVIQSIFAVIRNNGTFNAKLNFQLAAQQQKALDIFVNANKAVSNAAKVLARASCGNDHVTGNDFYALKTYAGRGIAAGTEFIEELVTAVLLAASNSYAI